jgi:antitoxin (DNA-binding transcriptional repressor) of toxin-antitoxin stability system
MERIALADAERDFSQLVHRVYSEGITVELDRGDQIIARISPVGPRSALQVRDLNAFLQNLPKLGDDAEVFREDIRAMRRDLPVECDPWQ